LFVYSVWKRLGNLKDFNKQFFDVDGSYIQVLIQEVVAFSTRTFTDMTQHCLNGNKWSFENSFVFVGSVATTIGYGNVTPQTVKEDIQFIQIN
jgi:hypothetical protein